MKGIDSLSVEIIMEKPVNGKKYGHKCNHSRKFVHLAPIKLFLHDYIFERFERVNKTEYKKCSGRFKTCLLQIDIYLVIDRIECRYVQKTPSFYLLPLKMRWGEGELLKWIIFHSGLAGFRR